MDELAERCARFSQIVRGNYRNTYDHAMRSLSTCFNWNVSRRIAAEWQALGPDVIHINKQNLEDGLDLLRATRYSAIPSVCTIHLTQTATYLRARLSWLRDWVARWELKRYQGIFVAVQAKRDEALRDFLNGNARTTAVFNGVPSIDTAALRSLREVKRRELGLSDDDFLILGVGRLVPQKRPLTFLDVAKKLHARMPATKFLWVGDGNLAEQWNSTVAREMMGSFVSCVGWQGEVLPYLLAGDLLLHVAEFEGLPFVIVEAMSAGLACAVTRQLSKELSFLNESNVLFADDINELADKLRDRGTVSKIAKAGRQLVKNKLSVGRMAESYEQLYRETAKRTLKAKLGSDREAMIFSGVDIVFVWWPHRPSFR